MQLEQRQTLSQKLVLTQTMRQSLDCLQLSAPELTEYVQEVALSNPLLDVQSPTYYETALPSEASASERGTPDVRETDSWRGVTSSGMEDVQDFTAFLTREKTFRDHLTEQIGQMKLVDDELLRLCRFLIDCLDERGYLDCPLEELSREFDIPLFSLEQALFAVQMLDPPGVGARNLSECLTLQLAQGRSLDPLALKIARDGLEMLGKRNFSGLAVLLGVSVNEAKAAASKVLALNPIPSRSFAGSEQIAYVAPDAEFSVQQGQLVIELNRAHSAAPVRQRRIRRADEHERRPRGPALRERKALRSTSPHQGRPHPLRHAHTDAHAHRARAARLFLWRRGTAARDDAAAFRKNGRQHLHREPCGAE